MIRAAAFLLSIGLSACAWSNRANRPVWNAFEEHLVPEDDAAFVATLPLTVPGGVLAILTDTFVVHPAQVVDDAADDARELWEHMNWTERYYTELASLPVRTVGTPVVFVGSFLGRSCFDIDRRRSADEVEAEQRKRQAETLRWLRSVAKGGTKPLPGAYAFRLTPGDDLVWNDELQAAFEATRRDANAEGRLALYRATRQERWPPLRSDPAMGLRDPDPVIRYEIIHTWPGNTLPSDEVKQELCNDPNEMVRLAARRFCR